MKIYFAGAIRGGRQYAAMYLKIIQLLQSYGTVLTEHVGDQQLLNKGEQNHSEEYIHDRDMKWISQADLLVAEVSVPSLGAGYEIARALELKKDVVCLYNTGSEYSLSAMIAGCRELKIIKYTDYVEIESGLENHMTKIKQMKPGISSGC